MWLALACRARAEHLTTFEIMASKAALARETIATAHVSDVITLVEGDFLAHVDELGDVGFCFLDAEKDIYAPCYDAVVARLLPRPARRRQRHRPPRHPGADARRRTRRPSR
jgi:caffeoyl-CoA O-methyltransferase